MKSENFKKRQWCIHSLVYTISSALRNNDTELLIQNVLRYDVGSSQGMRRSHDEDLMHSTEHAMRDE